MSDLKACTRCKVEKPKAEFHKDKQKKDGLRSDCKACVRACQAENVESISAYMRAYNAENADTIKAYQRKWRAANHETLKERDRARQKANPEKYAAHTRNRRAMKRNAEGAHTAADVEAIFDSQQGKCASCSVKLIKSGKNRYHVDHIVALANGGSNDKYNLQCLCQDCNLRKSAKDPYDWAKEQGRLL